MTDALKLVDKLSGDNYAVWEIRMKALLVSKGFWKVIDPTLEYNEADTNQSEQALALIILALGEDQMVHVEDCTTARNAWKKLKKIYAEASTANRTRLYEKLLTLRLNNGDDARAHVHELARTRTQLRQVGVEVDDTLYKLALLRSLSTQFENLSVAPETQMDTLSIEDLHARIYREDARLKTNTDQDARALQAQTSRARNRSNNNRHITCFYCKKKGHKIFDCLKRQRDERDRGGRDKNGREENPHALTFCEVNRICTTWLVDSGANYHICNDRAVFSSIKKKEKAIDVSIGDGSTLSAKYEGNVNGIFKTNYGTFRLTLRHVLYIPTASVNLISVSQAAVSAYGTKFERVDCTIDKVGTDVVALKLKRIGRTYKATMTTGKSPSAEANIVHASGEAHNSVLWRRRLGHLSSDGMRQGVNKESWGNGPQRRDTHQWTTALDATVAK